MSGMKKEMAGDEANNALPQLDTIVILDRKVDMITPFLTQLTYEGLIDEFFNIKNSSVKLPGERFAQDQTEPTNSSADNINTVKQIVLNSKDELYTELRDKNFNAVGTTLSRKGTIHMVNEQNPSDITYVHSVFAPMSIRFKDREAWSPNKQDCYNAAWSPNKNSSYYSSIA